MSRSRIEAAIIEENFLAGTGPGGQNANKVASAVQLRILVEALGLPRFAERKLRKLAGSRLTQEDELLIVAREHRTREMNREAARDRAAEMVEEAMQRDARRIPTRASRSQKRRRVEAKKKRGAKKSLRGPIKLD